MNRNPHQAPQRQHHGPPTQAELERIYMPAMPPLDLFAAIGRWIGRWRRRRSLRRLLDLDDHLLQDLGYTRTELIRAVRLPLAQVANQPMKRQRGSTD
jgi:uncharacterized protein YjiS (DUF1127 family)